MKFQEWIGSLISLLAFAALFFLNQRKEASIEDEKKERKKTPLSPILVKKKSVPLSLQKAKQKERLSPLIIEDEHHDLSKTRTLLKSSSLIKLNPIPKVSGEMSNQIPRIRKILDGPSTLQTVMISREVLEKPRGWF